MSNWAGRLKLKMKELGLTQEALADKLGVTRSAVAHYVQGTRHPPLKQLTKLAQILKTSPAWLHFGETSSTEDTSKKHHHLNKIPILDWSEAANFNPSTLHNALHKQNYLDYICGKNADYYALQVKSDAMSTNSGHGISFFPNSYVIVHTNQLPKHGEFVIAISNKKNEAILRQYIEEGGIRYLKALNTQYPLIEYERNTQILGVVVANINFTVK